MAHIQADPLETAANCIERTLGCLHHRNARTMHSSSMQVSFRKPVRITITVPHSTHLALADRSDEEGRSLSNLAAYILENALRD